MSTSSEVTTEHDARETIAAYTAYADAERAVDWLSDQGFAVERLSIVGTGLALVEQVTGRVTTVRAALLGAAQGAFVALLFTLLLGVFFTVSEGYWALLLAALAVGLSFGALFGGALHALEGGRRDFASTAGMRADRFEVQADAEIAREARDLVERMPRDR